VLSFALAVAAWGAGCGGAGDATAPAAPRRVLLVSFDTTRADHVGAWGASGAHTPTLDALAARGVRAAQAISPAPMTQPSHATLFTAVDPPAHGLRNNGSFTLRPGQATLAMQLRGQGFATAAFVGALVLERQFGLARGFDVYDDRMETPGGGGLGLAERPAEAVADAARRWLESAPDRFLLFVHFFDPHKPYAAPSRLARMRTGSDYDAEIAYADAQLGRLLEAVDARFDDGGTLVVVVSDHGESLGEHGEPTHSYGVYDATQHVPLIFAGPGVPEGRVVEGVVRLADVTPTILSLLGAPPLPAASGRSLHPDWAVAPDAFAYVETLATELDFDWSPLRGIRTDRMKYVRAPRPELYDVVADPGELENLAEARPEALRDLEARLASYLAGMPEAAGPAPVDDATRRRLESLGYLVPDASSAPAAEPGANPRDRIGTVAALARYDDALAAGDARAALRELADLEPSPLISSLMAHAALLAGDLDLAETQARAALASGHETYHAWARLGSVLIARGRLGPAQEALARAHALNEGAPEPLVGLGMVEERRGHPARAEAWYQRALGTKLVSTEAYWRLASVYFEQGRRADAESLLAKLHEAVLLDPRAAARVATAEARAGRKQDALRRLDRSARLFPDDPELARTRERIEAL